MPEPSSSSPSQRYLSAMSVSLNVFDTSDHREGTLVQKNSKDVKISPKAVGFPLGFKSLDVSKDHDIHVKAHTEAIKPGKIVRVHLDAWKDTVLYSAGCNWLEVYEDDPDFQFGIFSTTEVHPADQPQEKTSSVITFPTPFDVPPSVIVWLSALEFSNTANWRVRAYVTEVTEQSFRIHIDSWNDTALYAACAYWIAHPSDSPHIVSGSYSTSDKRSRDAPAPVTKGDVKFGKTFPQRPALYTALNGLDISHGGDLNVQLDTPDNKRDSEGFQWRFETMNGILFSANASIRAERSTTWKDCFPLKLLNILLWILFTLVSGRVYISPHKETYITPASWAYCIWFLVDALFLGTIGYQFTPIGKRIIVDGISWRFGLLMAVTTIHNDLWIHEHYRSAFIASLLVGYSVSDIYYMIKKHHHPKQHADDLFVYLPFSLYHGWTAVLIIVAAFAAFSVDAKVKPARFWTEAFVFLALLTLESISAGYAISTLFFTAKGDLPGAIAITWALFAIFAHQMKPFIHRSALAFAVLSLLFVVMALVGLFRTGAIRLPISDEERA